MSGVGEEGGEGGGEEKVGSEGRIEWREKWSVGREVVKWVYSNIAYQASISNSSPHMSMCSSSFICMNMNRMKCERGREEVWEGKCEGVG